MVTYKKKVDFFETEDGAAFEQSLRNMEHNEVFNTEACYSSNTDLYPNNVMPFVDKHVDYMRRHPATDPMQYLANLRLKTRIR